ncbi:signal transduction histidine kinase [Desulfitobacterium dehalogenans ATCC 51507]|uniref:histidine kinase n=1 Tax=Desulfitobacterium dehalogenans (strain ATCC 51507 / DSM 9161 / JW/IU-DC1) TaxID=756499 RepID=I4A560_DESDJ|nr:HAMP domain-containing sensor histidine kinase [Desulfitobacterium dehalogenans]AFL99094.1 signal transduction histidine kinase [Desulfitobacterium dehalogenans ATCC 51507]
MRKFTLPLVMFVMIFMLSFLVPGYLTSQTPIFYSGSVIPEDIAERSYIVSSPKNQSIEESQLSLHLHIPKEVPELVLVFSDFKSVQVHMDGALTYSYDSHTFYQRVHQIPLPRDNVDEDKTLNIDLDLQLPRHSFATKIMLATHENAEKDMLLAYGLSMLTLGIYLLIVIYSLSLYIKKPSEKYLLLLMALALTALISALSNSNFILLEFRSLTDLVRIFRIVFSVALCFVLMDIHLPGKWNLLVRGPGITALTFMLILLNSLGLNNLFEHIAYSLALPSAYAVIAGCAKKRPDAYILLIGTAIREGLRVFFRFVELGYFLPAISMFYYYIPQFSGMIFAFSCMFVINSRFARKFDEVDKLVVKLEEANAHLDAKVLLRTQELEKANQKILEEQRKKHSMTANIFHDLRTPIFNAQGSAEMIELSDERNAATLTVLKNQLDYLGRLTEDLLLISKLEEGGITFNQFRVRLDSLCATVLEGSQTMAQRKGIALSSQIEKDVCVTGDAFRLKQVLENLMSNALKFTSENGSITLILRSEGPNAVIEICDTGLGIDSEDLPKIFGRYYYSKQGSNIESSGLGLSIAFEIVKAHQGEIRVESEADKGSTFIVILPLEQVEGH